MEGKGGEGKEEKGFFFSTRKGRCRDEKKCMFGKVVYISGVSKDLRFAHFEY